MKAENEETLVEEVKGGQKMTRKQAIGKAEYMAIAAATTMMLLSVPKAAHASTPAAPMDDTPSGGTWTKRTPSP